ncbi:MAG: hypothetical protein L3J35_10370 [Bacteroidales bacterium]|nr:hypothetical protein [Bacteroidales bacterium]
MKNIILTISYLFFFSSFIIGQSKKEQIANLNKRVDSLEIIISKQVITINQLNSSQIELKNTLRNNKEDVDKLVRNISIISKNLSLYKGKVDSLKNSLEISNIKTFIDKRDKKTYKIVQIENQIWMSENLAYNAGSGCWAYNNDNNNVNTYGYLYDWETSKNVCPQGWHLPSKKEFDTLLNNVGGAGSKAYHSLVLNGESGFHALLGGWGGWSKDKSIYIGEVGRFWSSTAYHEELIWDLDVIIHDDDTEEENAQIGGCHPSTGFSVRCIQD